MPVFEAYLWSASAWFAFLSASLFRTNSAAYLFLSLAVRFRLVHRSIVRAIFTVQRRRTATRWFAKFDVGNFAGFQANSRSARSTTAVTVSWTREPSVKMLCDEGKSLSRVLRAAARGLWIDSSNKKGLRFRDRLAMLHFFVRFSFFVYCHRISNWGSRCIESQQCLTFVAVSLVICLRAGYKGNYPRQHRDTEYRKRHLFARHYFRERMKMRWRRLRETSGERLNSPGMQSKGTQKGERTSARGSTFFASVIQVLCRVDSWTFPCNSEFSDRTLSSIRFISIFLTRWRRGREIL